ncbi:hypothetical protein GCM10025789_13090 [Tessaracoccus lubricantis]|uniref:Uncharacterized protein n=1 Tax=Tessaracoccus lubricantis TaxID=545543 RepID=A0ABP9FAI9_9ACTN
MDRRDLDDAATLMTLLHRGGGASSVRAMLSGWDMLQADIPSREQIETAASILVGSGFAEVDAPGRMLLTERGREVRRSVAEGAGMRSMPGAIRGMLAQCLLSRAPLALPPSVVDAALEDYRDSVRRRADRARNGRAWPRWWLPTWQSRLDGVRRAIEQLRDACAVDGDSRRASTADWLEGLFADVAGADALRRRAREALALYSGGTGSFQDVGSAAMAGAVDALYASLRAASRRLW